MMPSCLCCRPLLSRPVLSRRGFVATAFAAATATAGRAFAQAAPVASAGPVPPAMLADLVTANHILSNEAVVDGFGHVSVRHPANPERFLLSRSLAPAVITQADIMEFDLDGTATETVSPARNPYLERFIHSAIYRARPDVMSVIHTHSPAVIPFANVKTPLKPMNHVAGFIGAGAPVFEIRDTAGPASDMLISSQALGRALAAKLGTAHVVLMRGHGSTVAGQSIRHATYRAVYTEVNARMQAEAMKIGTPTFLNDAEAKAAMITNDRLVDRPWSVWVRKLGTR